MFVALGGPPACSGDDGNDDGGSDGGASVSNADFQEACENGVALCMSDPMYGMTFGAQDCSDTAIEEAYAQCDDACRASSELIIECQKTAMDCAAFAACVQ